MSYKYKKYTTTELIKLLQENEKGRSGRSREITFWVNGKLYEWLVPDGWGDGLVTDIGLYLKNDKQIDKLPENHVHKPEANQ